MTGKELVGEALALSGALLLAGCASWGMSKAERYTGKGAVYVAEAKQAVMAGNLSDARQSLRKALKKGPSAEAHYYLALIALEEGSDANHDLALAEAGESIRDLQSAQAFLLRGAMLEQSDPTEAVRCYQVGLKTVTAGHPAGPLLHRNLAALLAKRSQYDEALTHMRAYVVGSQSDGVRLSDDDQALWGLLLYNEGREDAARTAWAAIKDRQLQREIEEAIGESL